MVCFYKFEGDVTKPKSKYWQYLLLAILNFYQKRWTSLII